MVLGGGRESQRIPELSHCLVKKVELIVDCNQSKNVK